MNEEFIKPVLAELIEANAQALATLVAALSHQIDPERLLKDLRVQLAVSRALPGWTAITDRLLEMPQAALEAETLLRNPAKH